MSSLPPRAITLLSQDFVPNVQHVIIGRGKKHSKHPGNLRYSELVHEEMHAYAGAENKAGKSEVISRLVARVRETGDFVREAGNRWSLVEEHAVRTTTAQHFRDALYNKYRSSKEMKKQKRKQERRVSELSAAADALILEPECMEPSKKRARCVSPERDQSSSLSIFQKQLQQQVDYLSIFSSVFQNRMDMQSNPFEPTPINEVNEVQPSTAQSVFGAFVKQNNFQTSNQGSPLESLSFFEVDEPRFACSFQAI